MNATVNGDIAGTFTYTPASGAVLGAGSQTLSVTFTPTDTTTYNSATKTVTLVVNKATPVITWATPASVYTGTTLSSTQLNATASVAGTFVYTPVSGTAMNTAGNQTLSTVFTPTDTSNYNNASASVTLTVVVPQARIGTAGYASLQTAYDAAQTGNVIQLLEGSRSEIPIAARNITVSIKGGYNPAYSAVSSVTTIQGKILIRAGTLKIAGVKVK